jgi:hypothetical protein
VNNLDVIKIEDFRNDVKNRNGIQGKGFFMDFSVQMDLRDLQEDLLPVVAFGFDNIFGSISEIKNNINSSINSLFPIQIKDPYRFNLGFQISPKKYLDIRMDIMQSNESPEYRIEVCKEYSDTELSLYMVKNEKTILNDLRDSYHFMLGFRKEGRESYLKFYISYDNRKYFGAGFGFKI